MEISHPEAKRIEPVSLFKNGFPKRTYQGLRPFWSDLKYLISRRDQIQKAMRSQELSPDFRERLMLAVTEVNRCRYCRSFHVKLADEAGLSPTEIRSYLTGEIPDEVPEEQVLGVSYARYWAEMDGQPDPAMRNQLEEEYGEQLSREIEIALRMIRMGNLLGNTFDYLLYRISFRRWGGVRDDSHSKSEGEAHEN